MRPIRKIIVHCSATPPSMDIGAKDIDAWHKSRGWSQIGYHYVIRRDGSIEDGRPVPIIGAHARGHNHDSIGVCLVGGVDEETKKIAQNNFAVAQADSLEALLDHLMQEYKDITEIIGHRDVDASKECPSFDIESFIFGTHCLRSRYYMRQVTNGAV